MNDLNMLLELLREEEPETKKDRVFIKPVLKELNEDKIEEIHAKGKLTPGEKKQEYDDLGYCPFTNGCSRCYEFENCDDCLVDHVNTQEEWDSFISFIDSFGEEPRDKQDNQKMLVLE